MSIGRTAGSAIGGADGERERFRASVPLLVSPADLLESVAGRTAYQHARLRSHSKPTSQHLSSRQ